MERVKVYIKNNVTIFIMILIIILLSIFMSIKEPFFLTQKNFINILEANSYKFILAIGMTFIISSGAIDLSVGSIISLSALVLASTMRMNFTVGSSMLMAILAGALMGMLNGAIIHYSKVNPLIITLATGLIYRGISLIITKGVPITQFDKSFLWFGTGDLLGMEPGVAISIVIILISIPLMKVMKWGHYLKSIGGNELALKRSGINIAFYRITSYIYMAVMAAIVGLIITARLNSAEPNAGMGMEMDAITAVIMGGTPLSGGKGNIEGSIIAVFLLGIIRNMLTIMSVSSIYQEFITGIILLFSIIIAERKYKKLK
ncbi:ABC transporter permease [Peptacetobacter hiranonis]|uniref:ABC transporter permease n=1 Tax=Peptacetobacter hiranonis TaxID=89152 RepID=UPI001916F61F|nr:ABC transporter permease [Peptacetobacter hiranonis]QQQ85753.1 ABC transporter permease [Peptacetobacter hiranonis]